MILKRDRTKHHLVIRSSYTSDEERTLNLRLLDASTQKLWTLTIDREDAKSLSAAMLAMRFGLRLTHDEAHDIAMREALGPEGQG